MATRLPHRTDITNPGLLEDALQGFTATPKRLPSKYLYDAEGSRLFEAICELPGYHVTRAEFALLGSVAGEIAAALPRDTLLVEFGSGASVKTRLLLDAAPWISGYVPIDISATAVEQAAREVARDYPGLTVHPLIGDFSSGLRLPLRDAGTTAVGYFPGSTIGNFAPDEASAFLRSARTLLGKDARFILGADHLRDPHLLVPAYDDPQGVTAAFNLNLLTRLNRECAADFVLERFAHRVVWNAGPGRMEMHLVSLAAQVVTLGGVSIPFAAGETVHTESSYKYLPEDLEQLAETAGWRLQRRWLSEAPHFGILLFGT